MPNLVTNLIIDVELDMSQTFDLPLILHDYNPIVSVTVTKCVIEVTLQERPPRSRGRTPRSLYWCLLPSEGRSQPRQILGSQSLWETHSAAKSYHLCNASQSAKSEHPFSLLAECYPKP